VTNPIDAGASYPADDKNQISEPRRAALKKFGRFAVVTAPAVTLLLAAGSKPAVAQTCSLCPSSAALKLRVGETDLGAVLAAAIALPDRPSSTAFQTAFGIGSSTGTAIEPIDAVGVCLAAIKALSARLSCLQSSLAPTS
jgi:hypothetical protein